MLLHKQVKNIIINELIFSSICYRCGFAMNLAYLSLLKEGRCYYCRFSVLLLKKTKQKHQVLVR